MPKLPDTVEVLPSPRRLIEALRDVGYDFVGAVADLVDNSIAANATLVDIKVQWDGAESWLRISDNGSGMDGEAINEALRFGSQRSYRTDDLGKFGLGLKTASLSQCRSILVASRIDDRRSELETRRFDLDRIIRDNRWEVEILSARDRPAELVEPLAKGSGTVVLWSQLDRLPSARSGLSDKARRSFWELIERLEQHLGMVFHRFIEGDVHGRRRRPLTLTVNGNRVHPWNPFAIDEAATQHLQVRDYEIASNGVSGIVTFDPWVLPARDAFSSEAEFNRLAGPAKWNQQQGFYVYRANRMIQSGGWSRMRAPDEHTKLARVALDFFPELDAAFGINIAKMRVNLPPQLRDRLKDPIEDLIRIAKRAYNPKNSKAGTASVSSGGMKSVVPATKPPIIVKAGLAGTVKRTGDPPDGGSDFTWPPPRLSKAPDLRAVLLEAAESTGDQEALDRILSVVRRDHPEVARVLGW